MRPKVVLLGMMSKIPVSGVVWQTLHYLLGLERLGCDAYYVEAHSRTPSMFMESASDDASGKAAAFIAGVMGRFGLRGRWAFHALHDDGRCYGMAEGELRHLYRSASLIVNLHGGTAPLPEHAETGRLIYLETDPVQLQVELESGLVETVSFLEPHVAFFTFAENYGAADCALPVSDRFRFLPTRQPVVLDLWSANGAHRDVFTTVGNWKQHWRDVHYRGEHYTWSKHLEFAKFVDLPGRTDQTFELALASCEANDRVFLEHRGWRVRPAAELSADLDAYRAYVTSSRGEWTVAKDQNVRFRSGWFSDRSATYLAAGRPVITQDTGFGAVLPTGQGLFAFSTIEELVEAVETVNAAYDDHCRAAREIAREHFDSDIVLGHLLEEVGL